MTDVTLCRHGWTLDTCMTCQCDAIEYAEYEQEYADGEYDDVLDKQEVADD